jgi:hypothetical protein
MHVTASVLARRRAPLWLLGLGVGLALMAALAQPAAAEDPTPTPSATATSSATSTPNATATPAPTGTPFVVSNEGIERLVKLLRSRMLPPSARITLAALLEEQGVERALLDQALERKHRCRSLESDVPCPDQLSVELCAAAVADGTLSPSVAKRCLHAGKHNPELAAAVCDSVALSDGEQLEDFAHRIVELCAKRAELAAKLEVKATDHAAKDAQKQVEKAAKESENAAKKAAERAASAHKEAKAAKPEKSQKTEEQQRLHEAAAAFYECLRAQPGVKDSKEAFEAARVACAAQVEAAFGVTLPLELSGFKAKGIEGKKQGLKGAKPTATAEGSLSFAVHSKP